MPGPARIALRLLGLLLLLLSAACLVLIVAPGPHAVADAMGVSCAYSEQGPSEQCTRYDAVTLLWTGAWAFALIGFVLRLMTRGAGKRPWTIDLRRLRG